MTNQHPITPPPGLVQEWIDEPQYMTEDQLGKRMHMISMNEVRFREIIGKASEYGAGMELDKSNNWLVLNGYGEAASRLRAARRPQPPTLKEQAMRVLVENGTNLDGRMELDSIDIDTIRRALEALPDG
jgi:hypothetical protein